MERPVRAFARRDTARTSVRLLLAARSQSQGHSWPASQSGEGPTPRAPRPSPISEHRRIVSHVASWSCPATRVRAAFPSGIRGSFPAACAAGFQGAESRSSPLPAGRSLSRFGSVPHDSHQQAVARAEARTPPFMVELFAARLSPRVPELPSPGWCASRRPSSPRWPALHGRSSRREPRRWTLRRVPPRALVLCLLATTGERTS